MIQFDALDVSVALEILDLDVVQQQIVAFITKETSTLTTAIARTEREIALMQEYRTRLTADLVTGKLDVREAAAKLPELEAEPAAEDAIEEPEPEVEL